MSVENMIRMPVGSVDKICLPSYVSVDKNRLSPYVSRQESLVFTVFVVL